MSLREANFNPQEVVLRPLTFNDITAAMKLKESAGWNQTDNDWNRLLRLEPRGCFAASVGGQIVGTATTTRYGSGLAWIGMVLVASEFRRKGIATKLINAALECLRGAGVATVKLDATPEGRAVYESLGFESELLIERWSGLAGTAPQSSAEMCEALTLPQLFALDRRAFGADRSVLLEELLDNECLACLVSVRPDGRVGGYVMARRGALACYIGPLVAEDGATAASLLDGALGRLAGQQIYLDLNTTFEGGAQLLAARGFVKRRDLIRMRYGAKSEAGTSGIVFAIAGPEVG